MSEQDFAAGVDLRLDLCGNIPCEFRIGTVLGLLKVCRLIPAGIGSTGTAVLDGNAVAALEVAQTGRTVGGVHDKGKGLYHVALLNKVIQLGFVIVGGIAALVQHGIDVSQFRAQRGGNRFCGADVNCGSFRGGGFFCGGGGFLFRGFLGGRRLRLAAVAALLAAAGKCRASQHTSEKQCRQFFP